MGGRAFTKAEQVLIYPEERSEAIFPPPIEDARIKARKAIAVTGLPSRKQENWHYTDLRILLRDVPVEFLPPQRVLCAPLVDKVQYFGLSNGHALDNDLPDFVIPLKLRWIKGDEEALPQWRADDIVGQINAAHVQDGFKITLIEDNFIEIQNNVDGGQAHIYLPISVAENVCATIVIREMGGEGTSFSTTLTTLDIGKCANVCAIILRQRGLEAAELNQFRACLQEGAKLTLFVVNAGGKLIRQEINVDMQGRGSDFQLRAINLLSHSSHTDITMDVRHLEEASTSTEIIRNVVRDRARGVFQGIIRVAPQAQKTDARMACNSLILSDGAEFDAKPELEIFADDVACGHGATVAQINPDHLFYLMARGIPEHQARGLLIKAFVDELVEEIERNDLQISIKNIVDQWLEENI